MVVATSKALLKLKPHRDLLLQILVSLLPSSSAALEVVEDPALTSPATLSIPTPAKELSGDTAIAEYLASLWKPQASSTPVAKAQAHDALLSATRQSPPDWPALNASFSGKTFVAGNAFGLGDLATYAALYVPFSRLSLSDRSLYYHVTRYMDLIQHLIVRERPEGRRPVTRLLEIDADAPVVWETVAAPEKESKKGAGESKKGGSDGAAAKQPAEPKDKKAKKTAEPPAPSGPHPFQLDIRVGKVLSVNRHPDADALYIEEVDVGEETPRTVVSGLVKFMPPESIDGKLILLLCNLKPAKMRGVESQAMVLTAESVDGTKVELLAPPPGSKPGDRAVFDGTPKGTPDPVLTPKKKIWEGIQGLLKLDAQCRPVYVGGDGKGPHILVTDKGPCSAQTIKDGRIK